MFDWWYWAFDTLDNGTIAKDSNSSQDLSLLWSTWFDQKMILSRFKIGWPGDMYPTLVSCKSHLLNVKWGTKLQLLSGAELNLSTLTTPSQQCYNSSFALTSCLVHTNTFTAFPCHTLNFMSRYVLVFSFQEVDIR